MTLYCCKYVNNNRNTVFNYVRTENELTKVCIAARRQGFIPIKTVINLSDDGERTEDLIK